MSKTPPRPRPAARPAPEAEVETAEAEPRFAKTPLFTANHAARYQRQDLVREIERARPDATLLCFVGGERAEIQRNDTAGFVDLLYNVREGENVDLMLHSIGGDIDVAEKLIRLVRYKVGEAARIRVVVPEYAKSAATLMALGADSLVMSHSSELGPIDPQFHLHDGRGNDICHSIMVYLAAYEEYAQTLRDKPDDPVAQLMFDKFDPTLVKKFKSIQARTRNLAQKLVQERENARSAEDSVLYTTIVASLMDIGQWQSHNQMISAHDAAFIGLQVEVLSPDDSLWRSYWQLYCLLRIAIESKQKIFESNYVSLVV